MIVWICIAHTHTAGLEYSKDVWIILIISGASYLTLSIIESIDYDSGKPFCTNVSLYLLITALAFNSYQAYKIITAKKGVAVTAM